MHGTPHLSHQDEERSSEGLPGFAVADSTQSEQVTLRFRHSLLMNFHTAFKKQAFEAGEV